MPNFEVSNAVCKPRCERVPISGTSRSVMRAGFGGLLRWPRSSLDRLFNQTDLVNRIDVDRVDSGAHRFVEFVVALAGAVENDLIGAKADAQRLEEFAAAVDLDVDARLQHRLEHRHV